MTEAEWDACDDPKRMIHFAGPKASDRKLRLCACACCRMTAHRLRYETDRRALQAVERILEGEISADEAAEIWRRRNDDLRQRNEARLRGERVPGNSAGCAVNWACLPLDPNEPQNERRDGRRRPLIAAEEAAWWAARADVDYRRDGDPPLVLVEGANTAELCAIVRDIFGGLFRPRPIIESSWLAWGEGAVRNLVESIYKDRAFDRLPLLADGLEDAGCADAAILAHCRGPGPHVRGCWAVDLLLGKS